MKILILIVTLFFINLEAMNIVEIKLSDFREDTFYKKRPIQDKIFDINDKNLNLRENYYISEIKSEDKIKDSIKKYLYISAKNFFKNYLPFLTYKDTFIEIKNKNKEIERDYKQAIMSNYLIHFKIKKIYIGRNKNKDSINYEALVIINMSIYDILTGKNVLNENLSGYANEIINGKYIETYTTKVLERAIDNLFIKNQYAIKNKIGKIGFITNKYIKKGNKKFYIAKVKYKGALEELLEGKKVRVYRNIYEKHNGIIYDKILIGTGLISNIVNNKEFYIILPRKLEIMQGDYIRIDY